MSYKRANVSQICLILYIVLAPSRAYNAQETNTRVSVDGDIESGLLQVIL